MRLTKTAWSICDGVEKNTYWRSSERLLVGFPLRFFFSFHAICDLRKDSRSYFWATQLETRNHRSFDSAIAEAIVLLFHTSTDMKSTQALNLKQGALYPTRFRAWYMSWRRMANARLVQSTLPLYIGNMAVIVSVTQCLPYTHKSFCLFYPFNATPVACSTLSQNHSDRQLIESNSSDRARWQSAISVAKTYFIKLTPTSQCKRLHCNRYLYCCS